MRLLTSSLVLLFVAFLGHSASASDVVELTDANFESRMKEFEVALVKFYAPWCGHCKRMAPEFDKASGPLKANDPSIALVKVDCTTETKICGEHGVSGYPTLKIFKKGEMSSEYAGPREADGIIKYMRTKAGPTSKHLKTIADIETYLKNDEHSIVGFFSKEDSELAKEFKKTADALAEDYRFAYTTSADILEKYKHKDEVVIYQPPRLQVKLLETENVYKGSANVASIKKFIKDEIHGIVGHRTTSNVADFSKKPLVVVYYNVDYLRDTKGTNYVRNRVIKVAQKLKKEGLNLNFAISNDEDFSQELNEFGFDTASATKSPSSIAKFIAARGAKDEKFKFEGQVSVENLEKFSRDLVAGKLEAYMKSEPIPESNPDNVVTVVGKTFQEIVNNEDKDVLIEFYAPWCGHCKSLAPKYEELATKLKGEKNLVIAKIDATANDIPPLYEVRGFPTIFFAKKGSKNSPNKYEGGREVDDFIKYLAKESTDPLKSYDRKGKKVKKSEL